MVVFNRDDAVHCRHKLDDKLNYSCSEDKNLVFWVQTTGYKSAGFGFFFHKKVLKDFTFALKWRKRILKKDSQLAKSCNFPQTMGTTVFFQIAADNLFICPEIS